MAAAAAGVSTPESAPGTFVIGRGVVWDVSTTPKTNAKVRDPKSGEPRKLTDIEFAMELPDLKPYMAIEIPLVIESGVVHASVCVIRPDKIDGLFKVIHKELTNTIRKDDRIKVEVLIANSPHFAPVKEDLQGKLARKELRYIDLYGPYKWFESVVPYKPPHCSIAYLRVNMVAVYA